MVDPTNIIEELTRMVVPSVPGVPNVPNVPYLTELDIFFNCHNKTIQEYKSIYEYYLHKLTEKNDEGKLNYGGNYEGILNDLGFYKKGSDILEQKMDECRPLLKKLHEEPTAPLYIDAVESFINEGNFLGLLQKSITAEAASAEAAAEKAAAEQEAVRVAAEEEAARIAAAEE